MTAWPENLSLDLLTVTKPAALLFL